MTEKPDLATLFGAGATETFLGLDRCDDLGSVDASSVIIGAPCATPYPSVGPYCRNAPDALRASMAGLAANIDRYNFDLGGLIFPADCKPAVDAGNLSWDAADFSANRSGIRDAVARIAKRGAVPVVIGGDDSVPIPMLEAMGGIGGGQTVLQIDAHIDWRPSHMGETMGLSSTMRRASEMAHIDRIVQVGARGIGSAYPQDVRDAREWGVRFFTAEDVHNAGTAPVLDALPADSDIIICLDVDAMDPSIVPGVIGRTPGGLSYVQTLNLIRGAAARGRIVAVDVVEYVPEADVDGLGALTVSRLIAAILGLLARQ